MVALEKENEYIKLIQNRYGREGVRGKYVVFEKG